MTNKGAVKFNMEKKSKIKKESWKNMVFYLIMIFMLSVSVYIFLKMSEESISVGGFGKKEKTFSNVSFTDAFEKLFGNEIFIEFAEKGKV